MANPKKLFTYFLFLSVFACSSSNSLLEKKLSKDLDRDGIANFVDSDSIVYGPVIDKNGNGYVDKEDSLVNKDYRFFDEIIHSQLKYNFFLSTQKYFEAQRDGTRTDSNKIK